MANLYYFFYKNQKLISSITSQVMGGEPHQTQKKVAEKQKKDVAANVKAPLVGVKGLMSTESTDENYEILKAGDNYLVKWLESLESSNQEDEANADMRIMGIKGTAMTVDTIKFVIISEAVAKNKCFDNLPENVLNELLKIYYPDPVLCMTSDGKEYIMPLDEEYIEVSNWVSQYGIEMPGEYEAKIIYDDTAGEEKPNFVNNPELEELLEKVDGFIKDKTNIDLRNGRRAIPIVVYKKIG